MSQYRQINKVTPRRLVFYEIVGKKLIKHNLRINESFRRLCTNGLEVAFFARVIWPLEYNPFLFRTQYDWLSDNQIVWKKSKPFQDLLNINNEEAVTCVDNKLLELYGNELSRPRMDLMLIEHRNKIKYDDLWRMLRPEDLLNIHMRAVDAYSIGNINTQPITLKGSYLRSNNEKVDSYLLPTHNYILPNDSELIKQGRGIMPGIIELKEDQYLSQLIDIGKYDKFLSETDDRDTYNVGLNYIYEGKEIMQMEDIPEPERKFVLEKAKKDKKMLGFIKGIKSK